MICTVPKALLCQLGSFFIILRDAYAFNPENDRPGVIVAADNHYPVIVRPALRDRTALESRIYISADGILF